MQVDILEPDDPRWKAMLRTTPHDFYALPGYVALSARFDGGQPVGVLAVDGDDQLLLPLIMREVPRALTGRIQRDAASPYGYPGIVLSAGDPASPAGKAFLDTAMVAVIAALRAHGVVSLFVRLHPLLPVDSATLARHGVVVDHGHTVSVDLLQDEADLFRDLQRNHAKNLRRLDRLGFTCELDEECGPETIAAFVEVYTETMDRLDAAASYYFDAAYVRDLVAALEGRVAIALVRPDDDQEVAAVGLFTEIGGIVQDHIGGTRDEYTRLAPSKLKIREAAKWARARGNRVLHLGGGLGGAEDKLFAFKAAFSSERHLFQTARFVVDQPAYEALSANWAVASGRPVPDLNGYFPAYRSPTGLPDPAPLRSG
jgi:hypothetical protein